MTSKFKVFAYGAALSLGLVALAWFLTRDSTPAMVDLRDGTRLQLVHVSFSTNHVAHFSTPLQRVLFKIVGTRLPPKLTGYRMVVPSQRTVDGNLGLFVRHHIGSRDETASAHTYRIRAVSPTRLEQNMFLSSSHGEYALWELNHWTHPYPQFQVENSRGELVARFQIIKDNQHRYRISGLRLQSP